LALQFNIKKNNLGVVGSRRSNFGRGKINLGVVWESAL